MRHKTYTITKNGNFRVSKKIIKGEHFTNLEMRFDGAVCSPEWSTIALLKGARIEEIKAVAKSWHGNGRLKWVGRLAFDDNILEDIFITGNIRLN